MIEVYGKSVPTSIDEVVRPSRTALLIIDMQNDFCARGGSAAECGADLAMYDEMVPRIVQLADACRTRHIPVIHVRMLSLPNGASDSPSWIRMRMRATGNSDGSQSDVWTFAIEGTWGADFLPALQPESGDIVVSKFRSSAFYKTNLDLILRSNGVEALLVSGCTTEGCVESTVRDAGLYDYMPVVVADCVGSDVPDLHAASMLVMKSYRADVLDAGEALRLIGATAHESVPAPR